jgi:hypothetical protein
MRLINCKTEPLCQEEFEELDAPPFAILSHTWGAQEVTYQQFADVDTRQSRQGWAKVLKACSVAREHGFEYAWIDSCCIDKTNTSELAESINSMFRWYNIAAVCIAFLGDFDATGGDWAKLHQARWFTRGVCYILVPWLCLIDAHLLALLSITQSLVSQKTNVLYM